ncbi:esterase FrsA [Streptomyces sp. NBC_01142]|uniref:alpha/beta hydrolase n=1 Tax=Streptomyces sp. NBC_01142 TaxID=2975865 RepID=UPI00224FE065|nr:alpha/beta hydrolase [Streptomyces sp. NBC_01142]MCX4820519.1 esterase FrsA [Streptomyces sp. NBC_01142]
MSEGPGPSLDELRRYARLHARAQGLAPARCRELLAKVAVAHGDGRDSWATVWSRAGDGLAGRGRHLEACRHYGLARFPYAADGDAVRIRAGRRCVETFDRWRRQQRGIQRLELSLPDGRFACWTAGLSAREPRPLIVVMGGIVSVKEQWAPILARADALGVALAVTEMPGVGENTLPYRADSHRMLSAVLDQVADRADTGRTSAIALSFGGHLALRAALVDDRVRGVATVGAPLRHFFLDGNWQRRVPDTTVLTLAHLIGCKRDDVFDEVRAWALSERELRRLHIPVTYAAALRDDIVPLTETGELLRDPAALREVLLLDDEHGAPAELARVRVALLRAALRAVGAHPVRRGLLAAASGTQRLLSRRGRLAV